MRLDDKGLTKVVLNSKEKEQIEILIKAITGRTERWTRSKKDFKEISRFCREKNNYLMKLEDY